jgi:hypothetical protein
VAIFLAIFGRVAIFFGQKPVFSRFFNRPTSFWPNFSQQKCPMVKKFFKK